MAKGVGSNQETHKTVYQMLFLDFPRPVGTVEFKRVWEIQAPGKGL